VATGLGCCKQNRKIRVRTELKHCIKIERCLNKISNNNFWLNFWNLSGLYATDGKKVIIIIIIIIMTSALAKCISLYMVPLKMRPGIMFRATISPSWGYCPLKFQKTCLGYCQRLVPKFMPISKVPVEKTMTNEKRKNKETVNLVSLHKEG